MRALHRSPLLLPGVLIAAVLVALPARTDVSVAYAPDALRITGLTPTGRVLVYAVTRYMRDGDPVVQRVRLMATADQAGGVVVAQPIPFQSIWFIVDLPTGAYRIFTPPRYIPGSLTPLAVGPTADSDWLSKPGGALYACVARPGVSAWEGEAANGSALDADGRGDANVTIALNRLRPLDVAMPAPRRVSAGDILFAVDPDYMRYSVTQLH